MCLRCLHAFLLQMVRTQTLKVSPPAWGPLRFHTLWKLVAIFYCLSLQLMSKSNNPLSLEMCLPIERADTARESRQFFNKKISAWMLMYIPAFISQRYRYCCSAWKRGLRNPTGRALSQFEMQQIRPQLHFHLSAICFIDKNKKQRGHPIHPSTTLCDTDVGDTETTECVLMRAIIPRCIWRGWYDPSAFAPATQLSSQEAAWQNIQASRVSFLCQTDTFRHKHTYAPLSDDGYFSAGMSLTSWPGPSSSTIIITMLWLCRHKW